MQAQQETLGFGQDVVGWSEPPSAVGIYEVAAIRLGEVPPSRPGEGFVPIGPLWPLVSCLSPSHCSTPLSWASSSDDAEEKLTYSLKHSALIL
ncbi:hypothetical protein VNO77_04428 [Canavalia gladiata]|uniref:Uncharacterized protein n=1 Tax=Canavalia gladiata TaxID=3824 RepID=A0AAN9N306_CANGL